MKDALVKLNSGINGAPTDRTRLKIWSTLTACLSFNINKYIIHKHLSDFSLKRYSKKLKILFYLMPTSKGHVLRIGQTYGAKLKNTN